ncbi:hypothetical protein HUJ05_002414 [Dendroctonus ponderosae]|nr:hypothetical protein HUJ05_002414 [Dendroctonus ponderosae]
MGQTESRDEGAEDEPEKCDSRRGSDILVSDSQLFFVLAVSGVANCLVTVDCIGLDHERPICETCQH